MKQTSTAQSPRALQALNNAQTTKARQLIASNLAN